LRTSNPWSPRFVRGEVGSIPTPSAKILYWKLDMAKVKEFDASSDLLKFLREIVGLCEKIENTIVKHSSKNNPDEDFFVYHFFHRSFLFGKSLILLVDNQFFHEAVLISRNILEGLFYFEAYRKDASLSTKWRLYGMYEDYRKTVRDGGKEAANALLLTWKRELGEEQIEEAKREFEFDKTQKWHKAPQIKKLVESTDLGYMNELYDVLYHDFSQVSHWTPTGVIGGQLNVNAALAVSFQCLYTISKYVNDNYELRFEDDLRRIVHRYLQHYSPALNVSQKPKWTQKKKSD
jgi:hypothetical protein